MGTMVAIWEPAGEPFACHLSKYMRTIVYRMPTHIVREGHLSPAIVYQTDDFRASIVTDPASYLSGSDFSGQYSFDKTFPDAVQEKCCVEANDVGERTFIVVQFSEDMKSFPAVDGQCMKMNGDGREVFVISDFDDAPGPRPDARTHTIENVVAALKVEFGITEGFEQVFNEGCYETDNGVCVYPVNIDVSVGGVTVLRPMALEDLRAKAEATRVLVAKMEGRLNGVSQQEHGRCPTTYRTRLHELIGALWLEPSLDDAYLQLWYLRLWDRLEKFSKACNPRIQVMNDPKLKANKDHRNDIAHRGVEGINRALLATFQKEVFRILRSNL